MAQRAARGFASMDPAKQREIASRGGHAAHERGTAHEFNSDEARAAGRRGGETVSRDRNHMAAIGRRGGESVSRDRDHMAAIGREGGESRHGQDNDQGSGQPAEERTGRDGAGADLPASVRDHLPAHAQEIFRAAFNSAWDEYGHDEGRAFRVAWAAVKHEYQKDDTTGQWTAKPVARGSGRMQNGYQ